MRYRALLPFAVLLPALLTGALFLALGAKKPTAPGATGARPAASALTERPSAFASLSTWAGKPGTVSAPDRRARQNRYGQLPLAFEENRGQSDGRVHYLARGSGYGLFLTSTEAVLALHRGNRNGKAGVLRMGLVGARRTAVAGEGALAGRVNYLRGSNRSRWRTDVPTFSRVSYEDVWPGIGLTFYGRQRELEYDFNVAPGTSPGAIRLDFGDARPTLDRRGDLLLRVGGGTVRQARPVSYQVIGGRRVPVASGYRLLAGGRVGIRVGAYDRSRPLVIDPVLSYSTYLGGSGGEGGNGVAVDSAGNAYLAGPTTSANFPTANALDGTLNGPNDAFVAKLNPAGSALVYSTYLGGGGSDSSLVVAVDSAGSAYLAGQTTSTDFPTANALQGTNGGDFDAFAAKLNPAGSALVYSTYLGGAGFDDAQGIALDSAGSAYLAGRTRSANFPTANPVQGTIGSGGILDAFAAKLNPAGSALVYSTYLGGSAQDNANDVAVDSAGSAYLIGSTASANFPTANALDATLGGMSDVFAAKLNAAGSALSYSTYLGGSGGEVGNGVAVDSAGNAYLTGDTLSPDFPTVNALDATLGGTDDAFAGKLNPAGSALVYSTYLGGSGSESGHGVAVDSAGNAYLAGVTDSTNFPTANALQDMNAGSFDAFVAKLSVRPTSTSVSCSPVSLAARSSTLCTVTVTDTGPGTPHPPTGLVTFSSDSPGSFSPSASCTLAAISPAQARCFVNYTPSAAGTHRISGNYTGDGDHSASSATATLAVNVAAAGGGVVGRGGAGGPAGPCGGGAGGGGGIAAAGGGGGGGGCFGIPSGQRLRSGRIAVKVGVTATGGATVGAEAFTNLPAHRWAWPRRAQLIGSTLWRRVRAGRYTLFIRFTPRARRQLRRMRSARIKLRLRLTAPGVRSLAVTRTVTLKR